MKRCIGCNNLVKENDNYCYKCGSRVVSSHNSVYTSDFVGGIKKRLKIQQIIFLIYSIIMFMIGIPLSIFLISDANEAFRGAVDLITSTNFLLAFLGFIIILMLISGFMAVIFGVVNLILAIVTSKARSEPNLEKAIKWGGSILKLILCIFFNVIALPFVISCFVYTKRNIGKEKMI